MPNEGGYRTWRRGLLATDRFRLAEGSVLKVSHSNELVVDVVGGPPNNTLEVYLEGQVIGSLRLNSVGSGSVTLAMAQLAAGAAARVADYLVVGCGAAADVPEAALTLCVGSVAVLRGLLPTDRLSTRAAD
jgi:hypothetical protein